MNSIQGTKDVNMHTLARLSATGDLGGEPWNKNVKDCRVMICAM